MTNDKTTWGRVGCGVVMLAATLLAGCGGMSKSDCEKADWRQLGQQDAARGQVAVQRYAQRAESCSKAGVATANQAEYMAGHAQGQIAYCSADRGRDEALAGQPPSGVCQVPQAVQTYRTGYDDGLQRFCTPKNGFDFGRNGFSYRDTCPAESGVAFQVGYRLGAELHELNRRLERIAGQQAEERKTLADTKATPTARDSANRRLGQLDGDEAAVRKLIRQAEHNALSIRQATAAATLAFSADQLVGHWELKAIRFDVPVDLNRDGIKSADALSEYGACQRDLRLEIGSDQKSVMRTGANTAGCKPTVRLYDWRLADGKVRTSRQENGRRIVDERAAKVLQLRGARSADTTEMVIESLGADVLSVRTELPDGSDSTSAALVTYARVRP